MRIVSTLGFAWLLAVVSFPSASAAVLVARGDAFEIEPPQDPYLTLVKIRNGAAAAAVPGGFVVAWQQDLVDVGLEDTQIEGRYVGRFTDPGPLFPIVGDFVFPSWQFVQCPDVAPLGGDLFVTAWSWRRFGGADVAFRRQRLDGSALDTPFRIVGDSLDDVYAGCPAVASNSRGELTFAWADRSLGDPERVTYRLQTFQPSGEAAGPIVSLGSPVAAENGAEPEPSVGLDEAGRPVVAWPGGEGFVLGRRLGKSGAPRGEIFRIGRGGGSPALAMKTGGGFVVAWSRAAAGGRQILLRGFDGTGRASAPPRVVAQTDAFLSPELRLDRAGRPLLFWVDRRNRFVGRLFSPSFEPLGGEVVAGAVAWDLLATQPYAGVALLGNLILTVWATPSGIGTQAIFGRYLSIEP